VHLLLRSVDSLATYLQALIADFEPSTGNNIFMFSPYG